MPDAPHRRTGSQGRWKGMRYGPSEAAPVEVSGGPIEKKRMEARYGGRCCNCRRQVTKGERIVYFPGRRSKPKKAARIMCDDCASLPAAERAERRP